MTTINKNNYYVVQFKDLPYHNIEKYIIIPCSWIIYSQSGFIYVAFPKEDPKTTRERVERNEGYGQNYRIYKAIVHFESSNFEQADNWISLVKIIEHEVEHVKTEKNKKNNAPDNSKIYATAAEQDVLTTNGDSTAKADKDILVIPISVSSPSGHTYSKEIMLKSSEISIEPITRLDSGTELLKTNVNIAKSIRTADAGSNCPNTSPENLIDKSQQQVSLKPQMSSRSSHHSSERKSPIVNDGHSHATLQRLSRPSINYPQFTTQNVPVLMNQHRQVFEQSSKKIYPGSFGGQQQHQQRHSSTQFPLSQSVVTKSPSFHKNYKENARSTTSPVQYYPKVQISRSPELRTVSSNYLQEVPCSTESSERIDSNEVTNNTPLPMQNLPNQSNKSPNCIPIVRGFLLQDPTTGTVFLRKENNFSIPKQTTIQDTTVNSASEKNLPPSECKSASGYTDYTIPRINMEKYFPEKPTTTASPVSSSQKTLPRQTSPINHCCCSCKCFVRKRNSSPIPNLSGQPVPKKQFSEYSDHSADQKIFAKELPVQKFYYPTHDKNSVGSEYNPQHVFKTENNIPHTTKMSNDSKNIIFDTHLMQQTLNYCESIIKYVDSIRGQKTNPANSASSEDTSVTKSNNQQNGNNSNGDDEAAGATKKPRSFILPPDYDPNDTRWTLKHREPGPGIVELIPDTKIYIEHNTFMSNLHLARGCNTLARILLMDIFSLSALRVCSLTGDKAKAFDLDGSNVRPGLDEHARMVLLTFVVKYGKDKGWPPVHNNSILNSIRGKLHYIRAKCCAVVKK